MPTDAAEPMLSSLTVLILLADMDLPVVPPLLLLLLL